MICQILSLWFTLDRLLSFEEKVIQLQLKVKVQNSILCIESNWLSIWLYFEVFELLIAILCVRALSIVSLILLCYKESDTEIYFISFIIHKYMRICSNRVESVHYYCPKLSPRIWKKQKEECEYYHLLYFNCLPLWFTHFEQKCIFS